MGKESVYSKSTVVLYNQKFPGSNTVADHYAKQRSIPSANVVGLSCPPEEVITRAQYGDTIAQPLRKIFTEKGWWTLEQVANQRKVKSNKILVITLVHGIPLKISDTRPPETRATITGKAQADQASVDSELALLGQFSDYLRGWQPNPYFRKRMAFGDAQLPGLMLVGRVDGPDRASCLRLIDDASEVEEIGLWGRAYVDLAQKTEQGYAMGENWLKNIVLQCHEDGISAIVDASVTSFPKYYPMDEAALYFGWYTRNANGPFVHPDFRLKKGAIACHIHSFSALTLRTKTKEWVGPLVDKGAAGVLGNVYEPLLAGTTHLDVFFKRLLEGYTLAEAAYMATPYLSWMSIVVGDPLYRPFAGFLTYEPQFFQKDDDLRFKTYHVATKLWSEENYKYDEQLKNAGKNHKTGFYLEALGNRRRTEKSLNSAIDLLAEAKARYSAAADKLRVDLQIVDVERQRGNTDLAISLLREMKSSSHYAQLPSLTAVTALLNQLDPPGPSGF